MKNTPKHISCFKNINNTQQLKYTLHLLNVVKAALPKNIIEHCLSTSVKADTLFVYTHSSAWAERLRFYIPLIQQALQQNNVALTPVKIQILAIYHNTYAFKETMQNTIPVNQHILMMKSLLK